MRTRTRDRGVIPLGHQHRLAITGAEQLVEVFVVAPVALHDESVVRCDSEVVDLFEVGRSVTTVVAMRRPARPGASRDVDLIENEPFGVNRRGEHVVDMAVCRTATAELLLHLLGLDQPGRVLALRRR